jgi:hypothetical protein
MNTVIMWNTGQHINIEKQWLPPLECEYRNNVEHQPTYQHWEAMAPTTWIIKTIRYYQYNKISGTKSCLMVSLYKSWV